ncbi:MAG: glycoside hydrolase family 99-like domain-containing protein [Pseudomonadota bacterium]
MTNIPVEQIHSSSENPLVSVVVRTKDRPKRLVEAIKSVCEQTHRPLEVVVVNDGGWTLSEATLKEHAGDVDLILIQLEQNQGRAKAANIGLQAATGRYLCFLDDDDRFLPEHIELLSSCLEHIEHRVCYSDAELCWQVYNVEIGEFEIVNSQVFGSRDFNLAELLCGNYIPLNTLLFDRQVLLEVGGFDPQFDIYEDWDLLLRVGSRYPFYHLPRVTAQYNQWSRDHQNFYDHFAQTGHAPLLHITGYDKLIEKNRHLFSADVARHLLALVNRLRAAEAELAHQAPTAPEPPITSLKMQLDQISAQIGPAFSALEERIADLGGIHHDAIASAASRFETGIGDLDVLRSDVNRLLTDTEAAWQQIGARELDLQKVGTDLIEAQKVFEECLSEVEQITALNQVISERDAQIAALYQTVAQREAQVTTLHQLNAQAEAQISTLHHVNAQAEAQIPDLLRQIADLHQKVAQAEAQLAALYSSTSWRVTAPLRATSLALRWFLRNTRRVLLLTWWLSTGQFSRATNTAFPYFWRYVPPQVKIAIPSRLSEPVKRWFKLADVKQSQPSPDRPEPNHATNPNVVDFPLEIPEKHYFDLSAEPIAHSSVKAIAFYLPQFHTIPENDDWWGHGFTEWTNTRRGRPLFEGHHQPRIPLHLGYYNLDNIKVYADQVMLARNAGIYGFCFYFYWFGGKTLLEKPLRNILANPQIDQPYCFCWANENWTRRWDGLEDEILIAQRHSEDDAIAFIHYVNAYFRDDRYIKIDGKPLLLVYRPGIIPDITRIQELWRKHAMDLGWPGLYLVSAQTFGQMDPRDFRFDAAAQFPPHLHFPLPSVSNDTPNLAHDFDGSILNYDAIVNHFSEQLAVDYKLFPCVTLGWDNTARRGKRATILKNFNLISYARWLLTACKATVSNSKLADNEKFVFINAWNEWGEGTYLEPDTKYGFGYLEATRKALNAATDKKPRLSVIVPNYNHANFLERRLLSIINQSRKPDEIIFLDDASSDNSTAIARDILSKSNVKYVIIENENNSGNVFKQWLKGLEHARGDLIWIAESDDDAAPDFLTNILPQFDHEDVLLAYGDISYIDASGAPNTGLLHYYDGLDDLNWERSHVVSAWRAFTGVFAIKNIIPNVSGTVFRKPFLTENEKNRLISYTFAGDWYFYALVARGGSIAFSKEAKSYFRLNRAGTSQKAFFSDTHISEHRMIVHDLCELYGINENTIQHHIEALSMVLRHRSPDVSATDLAELIKVDSPKQSTFRICIASYGFTVGGGEIIPIEIANALRARGHHVTFLALVANFHDDIPVLRHRLRNDIPVVYWDDVKHDFQAFLHEYGIECFNSHNIAVEHFLCCSGINLNIPYIASLHGGYESVDGDVLTDDFISYVWKNVDEWLYLSDKNTAPLRDRGLRDALFTKSFNAITCHPPNAGLELDIRKSLNASTETVLLVLASRAVYEKGWQRAIDVTRSLRDQTGRDCRLLLIGDGPDFEAIKAYNFHKDFVYFLGRLDNPCPIIKQSDVGIFPSTFAGESFPLFVLECLQSGLPVVATDIGEIPNIMSASSRKLPGHIASKNQQYQSLIEEMAGALAAIINDEGRLISTKRRARKTGERFCIERLADFYIETIHRHLHKPTS